MLQEFKNFALRGNLIDIAIGLVMATAFNSITSTFVDGIVMPLVSIVFQVGDMSGLKILINPAEVDAAGVVTKAETAIHYGKFISSILNFIIIAFVMFWIVKIMNVLRRKEDPAPPAGPTQEELLIQIRDLLKK